ncbi:MAG: hypothetical protein QOJ34_1089, partial [Pseudonocardiales bacterium]|nr:hypothetical protein [Pseudonocardiales bacterium]
NNEARDRRARAFTRGGRVFLPEDAGATHTATARGLLAHELVHAAQQRRLGTALPDESTPLGRELEAEAVHAEKMYSSGVAEDAPRLVHAAPPVSAAWVQDAITQHARTDPAMNYLADTIQLIGDQQTHFIESKNIAVDRATSAYKEHGGTMDPPYSDSTQLLLAQQQFLEVINQALAERDEPPQTTLSPRDQETVKKMFEESSKRGGAAGSQDEEVELRRDSTKAGGFFDNLFGGSTMTRGEAERRISGSGASGTGGSGGGTGGSGGGTGGGPRGGVGGGSTFQPGDEVEVRHDSTTARGFWDNAFGGAQGVVADSSGSGGGTGSDNTQTMEFRRDSTKAGGFFDNLFGGSDIEMSTSAGGSSRFAAGTGGWGSRAEAEAAGRAGQTGPGSTTSQGQLGAGVTGPQSLGAGAHQQENRAGPPGDEDLVFGMDDADLDELVLRIYDRLRSRLRRELLVDRERAGLLTDFR